MSRKEAIEIVYGEKAVEDFDKYEYRLPSEKATDKPLGCEHFATGEWRPSHHPNDSMAYDQIYRWPKKQENNSNTKLITALETALRLAKEERDRR